MQQVGRKFPRTGRQWTFGSLNQEDQGYSSLVLNQKEEKKIVDGMAHSQHVHQCTDAHRL
jgi:hypothetical protein